MENINHLRKKDIFSQETMNPNENEIFKKTYLRKKFVDDVMNKKIRIYKTKRFSDFEINIANLNLPKDFVNFRITDIVHYFKYF